jgi:hypothetical protein
VSKAIESNLHQRQVFRQLLSQLEQREVLVPLALQLSNSAWHFATQTAGGSLIGVKLFWPSADHAAAATAALATSVAVRIFHAFILAPWLRCCPHLAPRGAWQLFHAFV